MDLHLNAMIEERGMTESPITAQMFGNAGREHMEKYGMSFCSTEFDYISKHVLFRKLYIHDHLKIILTFLAGAYSLIF